MSSLVLLNGDGVVARKLQLISLPENYVVPEGMMISWRVAVDVSSHNPLANLGRLEPVVAYFCLGSAWGQVWRGEVKKYERDERLGTMRYGLRTLTVTVQGTSAKDAMELRDRIMHLIDTGARWEASNNLNPRPKVGFLRRLFGTK